MTHNLIPSDRVEGALVCGPAGEKIGTVERLMLDKLSGKVAYAVVKCGNALASRPRRYPVPWDALQYNPSGRFYEINQTLQQLRQGPSEFDADAFDWGERTLPYRHPQYWTV